jgi:hypothetical protein
MRQKAYYTTNEITSNLYTSGSQWQLEDGNEYIGLYHKYATGEVYTRATWNPTLSKKLVTYKPAETNNLKYMDISKISVTYMVPKSTLIYPSSVQRQSGSYTRYFIKKINDSNILEIDQLQYEAWQSRKIDPNLYIAIQITWSISGNIDDVRINNIIQYGVRTKNLNAIQQAKKTMPDIVFKLTNPLEYYSDIDFIVPADINAK